MFALTLYLLPQHQPAPAKIEEKVHFIENGSIRLGIDLNSGGSITYLAPFAHPEKNVVNNFDRGRQVQLSFYSGPVPFAPNGAILSPAWKGLGWNPIQTGDAFGNTSKVVASWFLKDRLYVKCIPLHWPLRNVPAECTFEVWLQLDHSTVLAHCRLTNKRSDHTQYPARAQELPAVYVNGPYDHLMTYSGAAPFSHAALTEIHNRLDLEGHWANWAATENWAAEVDDNGWGLGVVNADTTAFSGGFAGPPGKGDSQDNPTGYIAPNRTEILDHNIVYDYEYALVLGNVQAIRDYAYKHCQTTKLPAWNFAGTREGWSYQAGADGGWPIRHGLDIHAEGASATLVSPEFALPAKSFREVVVALGKSGEAPDLSLQWRTSDTDFSADNLIKVEGKVVGSEWIYRFPLSASIDPAKLLTQVRLVLSPKSAGTVVHTHSVSFHN